MKYAILVLVMVLAFACDKKAQGPAETLTNFIEYRFSNTQTKDGLLKFMTSKASEEISNLKEEDLADLLKVEKYRKRNFKIISEKCDENKCFMTYVLEYDVLAPNSTRDYVSEVKKIAELQKIDGEWKVANIDNIKTFIDATRPIDVR